MGGRGLRCVVRGWGRGMAGGEQEAWVGRWERVVGGSGNTTHQREGDALLMLEDDVP